MLSGTVPPNHSLSRSGHSVSAWRGHWARGSNHALTAAALLSLLTFSSGCNEQAMTLSEALSTNDRKALQVEIDRELIKQDPRAPAKVRMEALRQWIETQDGVLKAEVNRIILRTNPPVQQIWITIESDPDTIKTIGVVLDGESLRFDN